MDNFRTRYRTRWRDKHGNVYGAPIANAIVTYLLRDEFTTPLAAGNVNGTSSEPGPGTRTVPMDSGNNIVLSGGSLGISNGTTVWDATTIGLSNAISRQPGVAFFFQHQQSLNMALNVGFWATTAMSGTSQSLYFRNIAGGIEFSESVRGAVGTNIGTYAGSTSYIFVLVLKSTGFFVAVRGGSWTDWTVLNQGGASTVTPLYVGYNVFSVGANVLSDYFRIVKLPSPFDTDASIGALSGVLTGTAKAVLDSVCPP